MSVLDIVRSKEERTIPVDWTELEPGSTEYFVRVLEEINAIRTEHGMQAIDYLPQGRRKSNFNVCAVGEALDRIEYLAEDAVRRGILRYEGGDGRRSRKHTTIIADYENRFEMGEFPALERKL